MIDVDGRPDFHRHLKAAKHAPDSAHRIHQAACGNRAKFAIHYRRRKLAVDGDHSLTRSLARVAAAFDEVNPARTRRRARNHLSDRGPDRREEDDW